MQKKFLVSVFFILIYICAVPVAFSQASEDVGNSHATTCADLGIKVIEGLVSIDVRDGEICCVLQEIARKAKIGLDISDDINGKVTIKANAVPLKDVLKRLCENRAVVFEYQPEKQAYRIISVGAYSGRNEKKSEKREFDRHKHRQKQKTSGQLFSLERKKRRAGSMKESTERIYDSKGRLLCKPGELLVKFKEGVAKKQIADLHKSLGSTVLRRIDRLRLERIKLKDGLSEREAIKAYMASGIVMVAERHALRYANVTPNDTYFGDQWGLAKIRAPEAWDFTQGSPEVIIAVIDTGVDYFHPDLVNNMWVNRAELEGVAGEDDDGNIYVDDIYGWDFADNDSYPVDIDSHGTHVAGIIAAEGNNGIGVAGVCWHAKIMVLKVQADESDSMLEWDIIEAISYAIDNGAQIVNCSFGGEGSEGNENELNAFVDLKNNHILAVCAAGNEGVNTDEAGNENYPSCYSLKNIISVAASDQDDHLASFSSSESSNYGKTSVDVMAPGKGIKSTIPASSYTVASVGVNDVSYTAYGMAFAGITGVEGITGILYDCGKGYPHNFPPDGINGNIALIERGKIDDSYPDFYFSEKVSNAQAAGAAAVIIYNNVSSDDLSNSLRAFDNWTLGASGTWSPVVCISREDGLFLLNVMNTTSQAIVVNRLGNTSSFFGNMSGTSMAAPHVAGIAGLILSKNPWLDYSAVKSAILDTVDKIPGVSDKMVSGGRLNALNALCSVNTVPGDLSFNGMTGLDDAIIAIQIISELHPTICSVCIATQIDVNGDGRIGLEEAIFILQYVSGLR
ncbi:MAG: S8 family serine peptidase [Thermodesulfobacteriota bacterium]|nr:S8 family serine peptidase [Thermodesulfobacteriota bacterium]